MSCTVCIKKGAQDAYTFVFMFNPATMMIQS